MMVWVPQSPGEPEEVTSHSWAWGFTLACVSPQGELTQLSMKAGVWGEKSEELTFIWMSFPLSASRRQ